MGGRCSGTDVRALRGPPPRTPPPCHALTSAVQPTSATASPPAAQRGEVYRRGSLASSDSSCGSEGAISRPLLLRGPGGTPTGPPPPPPTAPSPKEPLYRHTALTFRLPPPPPERSAPVAKAAVPRGVPFARPAADQSRPRPPLSLVAAAPPQPPGAGGCLSPRQCGGNLLFFNAPLPGFPDPPLAPAC
eukprot:EG_transcript_11260